MLFNSYEFIFAFFPIVIICFFLISRLHHAAASIWMGLASIFFYGYWSLKAIPILLCSVCINYWLGSKLTPTNAYATPNDATEKNRKRYLVAALLGNIALLCFFKYANFFIENINSVTVFLGHQSIPAINIVLPIGISFFTFTQIAFLVDCWQGKVKERNFSHYLLFVTYFPHLIAGPILHHAQLMPQFARAETYRPHIEKMALGLAIFTIGLSKKLLIADPLSEFANVFFKGVNAGITPQFFDSWYGVLAYTFQIYFDFSGYSDMAIGLSLFIGIKLPINFNSPYKARSIIDFWRRWHISLSIFLRDYLYIPMGGNRKGKLRRYLNLFTTMLLGGLWHGANWTFVLWGAAHGILLSVNHAWRWLAGNSIKPHAISSGIFWLMTFVSIIFTWVLFRSDNIAAALTVYKGMLGIYGYAETSPADDLIFMNLVRVPQVVALILFAALITFGFNNANRLSASTATKNGAVINPLYLGVFSGILLLVDLTQISKPSPFLYFQF